jgi:aspartyl/asparaginyl beta-hydroxylase (cupin superfamily)
MSRVWYRASGKKYTESEPAYYESKDFSWAIDLSANWDKIKKEVNILITENDNQFQTNSYLVGISSPGGWTSLSYMFWGLKIKKDLKKYCPVLNEQLEKIPGLVSLSFSCLATKTSLSEHYGDTNAVIRSHFGIEIPAGLPDCGIKVNGEQKAWQEGKWVLFNDAYLHSAWNQTEKRRIVMIIDVIRPEYLYKKTRICIYIRARQTQVQIQKKFSVINKLPVFFKKLLFIGIYTAIFILKPIHAIIDR